jgi:hypothetical protein
MEKLDRLVWAEAISFTAYGVRVGVRANRRGVIERLLACLPPGTRITSTSRVERMYSIIAGGEGPHPNMRRYNIVYANASRIARVLEFEQAVDAFESDLQLYVAERAPRRLFVHAGVVSLREKAIVMPGQSFSGKTTLVAALVKAGAVYYSDEYAVFDRLGLVHHYARPLGIREDGQLGMSRKCNVEELGGRSGRRALPVGLVVISKYRQGARWKPRLLTAGDGALELLANTIPARAKPKAALATLQKVVARASVVKGVRGEAGQVVDFILEAVGANR